MSAFSVQNIMVREVVSVYPETPLLEAYRIIAEHNFDGVPVVDHERKLIGILTEYDFIAKDSSIHLPTLQKILSEISIYHKDKDQFQYEIGELQKLKVSDIMNNEPFTLPDNATFDELVAAFREHHRVNPIPVIDKDHKVIGVVSRYDLLKLFTILNQIKVDNINKSLIKNNF